MYIGLPFWQTTQFDGREVTHMPEAEFGRRSLSAYLTERVRTPDWLIWLTGLAIIGSLVLPTTSLGIQGKLTTLIIAVLIIVLTGALILIGILVKKVGLKSKEARANATVARWRNIVMLLGSAFMIVLHTSMLMSTVANL